MKIDTNKINKKEIEKLLLDKRMNISAADLLFEYCFYSKEKNFKDYPINDFLDLNLNNEEDLYFYESRIIPSIKEINLKDYENNYYRKNINPKPYKDKEYELKYLKIKPYQCLPYDDILIDENYVEVSQIGYFREEFTYLALLKDDVVWMSTDPNEINTMKDAINLSHGKVVAFGLGLGYFPIMCAVKEEVKQVLVIEKDQKVIDIFKKHILPLFPFKEKITIVHDDAFKYAKRDLSKECDFLFVDIWHNPEDGLPMYLKLKHLLDKQNIKVSYWLEKSILAMLRRCLLTVIEESLLGYQDNDYLKSQNEYDDIINHLYFLTKEKKFSSIKEIKEILQDNSLLKLV